MSPLIKREGKEQNNDEGKPLECYWLFRSGPHLVSVTIDWREVVAYVEVLGNKDRAGVQVRRFLELPPTQPGESGARRIATTYLIEWQEERAAKKARKVS